MKLQFTKMHGAGNDFVMIDATSEPFPLDSAAIRRVADRHFGIGADQILVVEPSTRSDAHFRYRIFNADGGEVESCGNGSRCFVRFVVDRGLTSLRTIVVETAGGLITLHLEDNGDVTVNMGEPRFEWAALPFSPPKDVESSKVADLQRVSVPLPTHEKVSCAPVSMGNPHVVIRVDDVDRAPVANWGAQIESHPWFPNRVNVGFLEVVDAHHGRIRVFERGSGETLACGTGACAAAAAGIQAGWFESPVQLQARGGVLTLNWAGPGNALFMSGPAETVFVGEIDL